MSKQIYYSEKPFKMVEDAEGLIIPLGPLYLSDRDFLTFELSFFYYFIYDYKIFRKFDDTLRDKILQLFLKKIQSERHQDFQQFGELNEYYNTRIATYVTFMQSSQTLGDFCEKCAEYINILISYSADNNVYTCVDLEQAKIEFLPHIKQDIYTDEIKRLLTISSAPILNHDIDPTENKKNKKHFSWFNNLFNRKT